MDETILKIDLDIKKRADAIKKIKYNIIFIQDLSKYLDKPIFTLININKIELIQKNNYSVRIYLNKHFEPKDILILQSIFGSDPKHTGVCYRDLLKGLKSWNRQFNEVKRNSDGSYTTAKVKDITKEILSLKK